MPNHYYFYLLDRDFGPLFIKFCSYFPYAAKLSLNGHEWLKRQLMQRGIPFEPLDNGIRSTPAARRVQQIADTLSADKIDAVFRKWLRRLPHPFTAAHRQAGYRYHLSILQAEFALTQGARSAANRARFLRGSDSREPRHRAARSNAVDLQSARIASDAARFARAC